MATLTDPMKEFIVTRYGLFERPTEIAKRLKEEFGVDITRQQVDRYNPEGSVARRGGISKKLVAIYEGTRAKFIATVDDIPIANRSYRLHRLNQMFEQSLDRGALVVAAQMLEQAAKEVGETFTNKREMNHSGGIAVRDELSTEDKRTALIDRMADAATTAAAAALRAAAEAGPPTIQ